ncbi:P63C domain-containing protein [Aminobacter aminovorans]|uniref:P63C domain n=1 Tax=Aminobacter aminovorans TaxID=83263 RepID=A0A380WPB6_AMIAI|nr:P63C domain-containing protein [Aminobacter aminovorans]SUU90004.1 P63C domain [Aminobacter aminovorans]
MSHQSKGGRARAKSLTSEQRREIAQRAAQARWTRLSDQGDIPRASHQGVLPIGDVDIEVYRLFDGRRLIAKSAMAKALTLKSEGGNAFLRTVTRKGVRSAIDEKLWDKIENPISFRYLDTDPDSVVGTADGYEATTLIEVCDALIQARNDKRLAPSQAFLAVQAEIIVRSAAKLGIVALVDAATGYIEDVHRTEYLRLWQEFVSEEFRQWEKEFPDQFADMIYKLYKLKRRAQRSFKHPQFFGWFTRKYIYHPLANSNGAILEMLDEANPVVYGGGGRRYKLHQFLADQVGLPALRQHLWQVIGIGNASRDKTDFDRSFYRAFPQAIPKEDPNQFDFFEVLEA